MPAGVRTPVVSMSTRASVGAAQALTTPDGSTASFKPPGQ